MSRPARVCAGLCPGYLPLLALGPAPTGLALERIGIRHVRWPFPAGRRRSRCCGPGAHRPARGGTPGCRPTRRRRCSGPNRAANPFRSYPFSPPLREHWPAEVTVAIAASRPFGADAENNAIHSVLHFSAWHYCQALQYIVLKYRHNAISLQVQRQRYPVLCV